MTGRGTLPEVRDGPGDPQGDPRLVGGPLMVVRVGVSQGDPGWVGDHLGGSGWVGGPSRKSVTGREPQRDKEHVGVPTRRSEMGRVTLAEVRDG